MPTTAYDVDISKFSASRKNNMFKFLYLTAFFYGIVCETIVAPFNAKSSRPGISAETEIEVSICKRRKKGFENVPARTEPSSSETRVRLHMLQYGPIHTPITNIQCRTIHISFFDIL